MTVTEESVKESQPFVYLPKSKRLCFHSVIDSLNRDAQKFLQILIKARGKCRPGKGDALLVKICLAIQMWLNTSYKFWF